MQIIAANETPDKIGEYVIVLRDFVANPCGKVHETEDDIYDAIENCKMSAKGHNMLCAHSFMTASFQCDNKDILRDTLAILSREYILSERQAKLLESQIDSLEAAIDALDFLRRRVQPKALNGDSKWKQTDCDGNPSEDLKLINGLMARLPSDLAIKAIIQNLIDSIEAENFDSSQGACRGVVHNMPIFNTRFRTCEVLIGADLMSIRDRLIKLAESLTV